jgi:hypothetical protein
LRAFITLLAALCPFFALAQTAKRTEDQPGRYQLFQGEYQFVNIKGESHWIRALFKIDTATGAMFLCEGSQVDGKHLRPSQAGMLVQRRNCRPFDEELVFQQ